MNRAKVFSIKALREIKNAESNDPQYARKIAQLSKLELLNEMVRFQETRSQLGKLTPELMVKGRVLFEALEKNAETETLQVLTRSYRRHLELELKEYIKNSQ